MGATHYGKVVFIGSKILLELGGRTENGSVASPESIPIYLGPGYLPYLFGYKMGFAHL